MLDTICSFTRMTIWIIPATQDEHEIHYYCKGPDRLVHGMLTVPATVNPDKACCGMVKLKSWKVRMDLGRDPTANFFQGWLLPVLLLSNALSDLVLFDTVVQHWLQAIDRDRIAIGVSLSLHPSVHEIHFHFWQISCAMQDKLLMWTEYNTEARSCLVMNTHVCCVRIRYSCVYLC